MIVTFVSECRGRAISETCKVLDAYAHRIGTRTWQATITVEALNAVRESLAKKARKNTAVSCHRIRGTHRTELVWIVGSRRRFDHLGRVPVHFTKRDLLREDHEDDWHYLPLMRALVGIASLFHDFGKAWRPFQRFLVTASKPNPVRDPWRHEWVSTLLFRAATQDMTASEFAVCLLELHTDDQRRIELSSKWIAHAQELAARTFPLDCRAFDWRHWIEWLIVSHHRLPSRDPASAQSGPRTTTDIFSQISVEDGFQKQGEQFNSLGDWAFDHGLPVLSQFWCKRAAAAANLLNQWLDLHGESELASDGNFVRPLLTLSRVALMIGDHEFSSRPRASWKTSYLPIANTIGRADPTYLTTKDASLLGQPRQYLDEHLVGVAKHADSIVRLLPAFENELASIEQCRELRKPSRGRFGWQNKCVESIQRWQQAAPRSHGFFGLNMASTGRGKTLANARIFHALLGERVRFSLALGLRTLTLQTGHQYREHLRLHESELAVLVGSSGIVELDRNRQEDAEKLLTATGAASHEPLDANLYFAFEDAIPEDQVTTILHSSKARQLLKAPILVCTIDHLIPAVEGTRGNSQPLPLLRLLSSDLIIDEVDDFDALDMPAVSRLIHLAGMLGRRVLLSSATIPPAVAEGLFASYRAGWLHHAAFRQVDSTVTAFWCDEFGAVMKDAGDLVSFASEHNAFVSQRVKRLCHSAEVRQKAILCPIPKPIDREAGNEDRQLETWHRSIAEETIRMHDQHSWEDKVTGKLVSIGIIRVANVNPCIDLSTYLLHCDFPQDYELRVVCYHARQVLLLRSEIERNLDRVLYRSAHPYPSADPVIAQHLGTISSKNVVFIVVASPIAEIGRDHDYDWAIVEPSSMRSIIQMAGRVRRHRSAATSPAPNVVLLEFNRRFYLSKSIPAFKWPGFEGMDRVRAERILLETHQLSQLVDIEEMTERIDSTPRTRENHPLQPTKRLGDLEHRVLRSVLTDNNSGAAFVPGWYNSAYWLTDVSQRASRFRQSRSQSDYRLTIDENIGLTFRKNDFQDFPGAKSPVLAHNINITRLDTQHQERLWMPLHYETLVESLVQRTGKSLSRVCLEVGELRLDGEFDEIRYTWDPDLGARKIDSRALGI